METAVNMFVFALFGGVTGAAEGAVIAKAIAPDKMQDAALYLGGIQALGGAVTGYLVSRSPGQDPREQVAGRVAAQLESMTGDTATA